MFSKKRKRSEQEHRMFKAISLGAIMALTPLFTHAATTVTATPPPTQKYQGIEVAQTEAGYQAWIKSFRAKALSKGISLNDVVSSFFSIKSVRRESPAITAPFLNDSQCPS